MNVHVGEIRAMRAEMEVLKAEIDRLRMQVDLLRAENDRLKATGVELYRRLIEANPDEGDDEAYLRLAKRLP